jgi:hypothetical protein
MGVIALLLVILGAVAMTVCLYTVLGLLMDAIETAPEVARTFADYQAWLGASQARLLYVLGYGALAAALFGFVGFILSIVATATKRGRVAGIFGIILGIILPVVSALISILPIFETGILLGS